ncbi:MAG: tetratricopeptide repeat protein [Oscillatoriales cyanobacterium C42_A2020_001]|nr:tetratricopeptide repeat protein [Leptolyngbyaceae cyanobacterium C42_A2020_001]
MPHTSAIRQLFCQEICKPDTEMSLDRAALYVALEEYPALDVEAYLKMLDDMAASVEKQIPRNAPTYEVIDAISDRLFHQLGYMGTTMHFSNPIAIHFNDVLDRRVGVPITLSLVYLAIARRVGLPMVGIGFPGHFLIRPEDPTFDGWVDPFYRGAILTRQDCQFRLLEIFRQPVELKDEYLQPLPSRQVLARLLTTLKMAYLNGGNPRKALVATERILLLFPDRADEWRDRGMLNYQLNHFSEARQDFTRYLKLVPNPPEDASFIQGVLNTVQ